MYTQIAGDISSKRLENLVSSTGKVFLQIDFDSNTQWVYANWIGYPTQENVAKGALAYLDWMKEMGSSAVLNDNRSLVGRWDQSLDWLEKVWIPHAVQTGLKHWAHLDNPGAFSSNSADQLRARVKGQFEVQLFDAPIAAEAWLKEKQRTKRP